MTEYQHLYQTGNEHNIELHVVFTADLTKESSFIKLVL